MRFFTFAASMFSFVPAMFLFGMALVALDKGKGPKGNTPTDLLKHAIREQAKIDLHEGGFTEKVELVVRVGGKEIQAFEALPTASVKDGKILFHAGGSTFIREAKVSVQGNIMLPYMASNYPEAREKYLGAKEVAGETMEAGETTS